MTDVASASPAKNLPDHTDWQKKVAPFRRPDWRRSVFQLVTTWSALAATFALALYGLEHSVWLTVLADLMLAGTIVRLFVLQHDCGHGSFFASRRVNFWVGTLSSVVLFTPYAAWARDHAIHHATTGDLERRGTGDITVWTVAEYQKATPLARFGYRMMRSAFVMLVFGPLAVFVVGHRVPGFFAKGLDRREQIAVHFTTVASLSMFAAIIYFFGWQAALFVHVPASLIAAAGGIFLFYAQHQIPEPYWARRPEWDFATACLEGSSHLKLGPVLRWFTGDIGIHHLHHLAPLIPNYRLADCLEANPQLSARTVYSLRDAFASLRLKLYDEKHGRMVSFAELPRVDVPAEDAPPAAAGTATT